MPELTVARASTRPTRRFFLQAAAASASVAALSACTLAPDAITKEAILEEARRSLQEASAGQEPVTRAIDLSEAMARAVLYGLDHRAAMLEVALQDRRVASAGVAGLPSIVANAGYAGRNEFDASFSRDISTGRPSLQTSTSQDRDLFTRDLAVSWNILDFGLSYVRAQQASDKLLITQEQRRRILARLVEEVRTAYWRALAAEYLSAELKKLDKEVRDALEQARKLAVEGQTRRWWR